MAMIGDIDPRIQALFDDNLAKTRRATTEVSAELKADQDRLAAEAKAREDKHQQQLADAHKSAEEVAKQGEKQQPRKPQWERPERGAGEMAFGPEDDDGGYSAPMSTPPPPPPTPQFTPPPPPPARSRRPVRQDDDDDDLSGQTWLS